ncbi:MAG: archaellin/type IV pilin N-terminal domain-containing protein [Candidatus Nanoarchaeia archaeon]|jgi:flagellin-like protein
MKSITPVISVILLVLITIVASVSAFFFINSNVVDLENQGNLETYPGSDNSRLNLVSITGSKTIVRNDGTSPVTEVVMFVNGELLNYVLDTQILPGELREINYTARQTNEDLVIKVIYNSGKITQGLSPASKNTAISGFTNNSLPLNGEIEDEPEVLEFLRVNSATIVEKDYGLEGYCNATSDNSNDLIRYNYTWKLNEQTLINDFNYITFSNTQGIDHSCGILTNGSALCWGYGSFGQLGNINTLISNTPIFVSFNYIFNKISFGDYHSCGILTNGSALCWGYNNVGQLGNGSVGGQSNIPKFVNGNYNFSFISSGGYHTCGILTNGSAVCWGNGDLGRLGNGNTDNSAIPVFVSGNYLFKSLTLGALHSCGILTNGSALCWGYNDLGQLGNGSVGGQSDIPKFVNGNYNFSFISSGGYHTCGILTNGSAVCWGNGINGQLGNFIDNDYLFSEISTGLYHSCGILTNGSALCWGYNSVGQLGNGSVGGQSDIPKFVNGNYNFSLIILGKWHSCGILTNGSALCWGSGSGGQLGNGLSTSSALPVFVSGDYNFINSSYYWNNDAFISMLPSSYYTSTDEITFECIAMNATSQSLPKNMTVSII